jgi:hypothetical protein
VHLLNPNQRLLYLIIIPLAIYLGWMLAEPMSPGAMLTVGLLFTLLLIPILLRWHRPMLMFAWNSSIMVFVLPGSPPLWMPIAGAAFLIILLQWIIEKQTPLLTVRSINWALGFLVVVSLITAYVRGGIGLQAVGGEAFGGKRYIFIMGAVIGYYALSLMRIPEDRVKRYTALFFLGGLTHIAGNAIAFAGPSFYWLFNIFSYEQALSQIQAEFTGSELVRLGGISVAMLFLLFFLLARYPIHEIFSLSRPWLPFVVLLSIVLAALGGFRSNLMLMLMVFGLKFILDRLLWTRLFFALLLVGLIIASVTLPLADKLPYSMQRTLSFLPFVPVDPFVRMDAQGSTLWRLEMWSVLMDDLPKYLLIGKGYVINPTDLYMLEHSVMRGFVEGFEGAIIAGDYHSGPLSVLVNFGIPGALGWLFFCWVSLRALIRNFRYGEQHWRNLNGLLLALYSAKIIYFFFIFGDFALQLYEFTGLLGLSVAINGGIREKPVPQRPTLPLAALDVRRFEDQAVLGRGAS